MNKKINAYMMAAMMAVVSPAIMGQTASDVKEPPLYGTKITIIRNNETFPIRQEIRVEKVKVDYTAALLNRKILKN